MHESAISPDRIKAYLQRFTEDQKNLALLYERLDQLQSKAGVPKTSKLTGIPSSPNTAIDGVGAVVVQISALADAVREAEQQVRGKQKQVVRLIDLLRLNRCRQWLEKQLALSMRYVDGATVPDVAFTLFADLEKYTDSPETYIRRTYGIIREALKDLSQLATAEMIDDYD